MEQPLHHIDHIDHTLRYVINIPNTALNNASNDSCPSMDKLIDYKMDLFSPYSEKYQQIKEHLGSGCKPCAEELSILEKNTI